MFYIICASRSVSQHDHMRLHSIYANWILLASITFKMTDRNKRALPFTLACGLV